MRTAILGKGMWIGRRPTVLTIGNYVKVKTLEEAYELNQARNSRIMGGMMFNPDEVLDALKEKLIKK